MILLGLGANLPSAVGAPEATLSAALEALASAGVATIARSPCYRSAPQPPSDQPWYVNAVAAVATPIGPAELLALLHWIEERFGRVRRARDEARVLDLDLLDYDGQIRTAAPPLLPHPRLAARAFVLLPLRDIVPDWRHPVTGQGVDALIAALPAAQPVTRL